MPDEVESIQAAESAITDSANRAQEAIAAARSNTDLTYEGQSHAVEEITAGFHSSVDQIIERAEKNASTVQRGLTRAAAEDGPSQPDEMARAHVRSLLDQGVRPHQILEAAGATGDLSRIQALDAELAYYARLHPQFDETTIRPLIAEAETPLLPEALAKARARHRDAQAALGRARTRANMARNRLGGRSTIREALGLSERS